MGSLAQYAAIPRSSSVAVETANPNRDGVTGSYGTLLTAGAAGSRIDRVNITATVTTTAGMIRFFIGNYLVKEVPVTPVTVGASTPSFSVDVDFEGGLLLAPSATFRVSTEKSESFNVTIIYGGDF